MAATPYTVLVRVEQRTPGGDWSYDIRISNKRLVTGDRRTRDFARRAASAQLKQLQRDIDKALSELQ